MAGKWSLYLIVCCMFTVLLPTAVSTEVQKTCVETCLRLFTPSVEVVTDCNTTVNELDWYGVKGDCKRHCDDIVESVCNKTGNCTFQTSLEVPSSPSFLNSEFKAITLQWENSKDASRLVSMYVLEVKSNRTSQGPLEILSFVSKYHSINVTNNTKLTRFTVKELPPETSYKFRVAAFGPDGISDYSNWSAWYSTNSTCKRTTGFVIAGFPPLVVKAFLNFPCPVSQLKLNVSLKILDKKPVVLDAKLYLKYPPNIHELKGKVNIGITMKLLEHEDTSVYDVCKSHIDDFKTSFPVGEIPTSINLFNVGESSLKKSIHFGCKYEVKVEAVRPFARIPPNSFETTSVFWIPECLQGVRSCPISKPSIHVTDEIQSPHIGKRISQDSNGNYTIKISWNIEAWKNLTKVEFFHITVEDWPVASGSYHHDNDVTAVDGVSNYHSTVFNMSEGKSYRVVVRAYHGKNCIHDIIERETFQIMKPCNGGCNANSTCLPKYTFDGSAECKCNEGFSGTFCTAIKPCQDACNPNATCLPKNTFDGSAKCKCNTGFTGNGRLCTVTDPRATKGVKKEVNAIAIVVPIMLALALALCVGALLWKRRQKRKRMTREQTSAIPFSSSGSNLYRYLPSTRRRSGGSLPEKNVEPVEDREVNLIYVPQEIQDAISRGLTDGYEFNAELLMLGNCLGKGAFGNVYYADAQGICTDPGWTPVAVKTLNEHTSNTYVESFLEEIEVMKKLGQHENVIKMLGCCTITMPICLILEYAPDGNLRSYLRTLRSKLEGDISIRRHSNDDDLKKGVSCEEQFEKSGGDTNSPKKGFPEAETSPAAKEPVTDFQAIHGVIESNELESFALQIANGMAYVVGLGIVHRDLAARNILIGRDRVLKISDFGLSKEGIYVKTTRGKIPLRWLSAEAIRERLYSSASDVWAFGIVLWEICTLGGFPYPSISDRDLLKFLEKGNRMEKPSNCTSEIYTVMLDCWSYLPSDRPSFAVLRDLLWKLKNNENPYVNVDPLQDFPPLDEGSSERNSEEEMTPDDLISSDPQANVELPDDSGENKETREGTPNHGFHPLDSPGDLEGSDKRFPDDKDTISKTELKDNVPNPSC